MDDRERDTGAEDDRAGLEARAGTARRSYERMRRGLEETVEWLELIRTEGEAADLPKGSEVERASKEYDRALRTVVELEGRAADAERIERGGDGIDLAAALAEILGRLALRAPGGGAGGVAPGAE